jgi:hypothetical protein
LKLLGLSKWIPKDSLVHVNEYLSTTTIQKVPQKPIIKLPPLPSKIPIPKPTNTQQKFNLTPKEHDKFIRDELLKDDNFPSDIPPIKENIGKSHLMHPRTYSHFHSATPLLYDYARNGCPVNCGPNWNKDTILRLLRRGPHRSSKKKDAIRQLRAETKEKITCGYARIVKWKDIKDKIPPKLKISPVAMIPHKSKKYRCILDLSFTLFEDGLEFPSVNETTTRLALPQAMAQLGNCLKRLTAHMADNHNKNLPFMFCKLDIKDGFWRMRVSNDDAWNFAYVLPSLYKDIEEDEIELVIPNSLQMGWCESPPFFCAGSETARDVIEHIQHFDSLPEHRFQKIMLKEFVNSKIPNSLGNVTTFEVFVDDFVGATNILTPNHLNQVSKAMIHGIHAIFPPPEITTHPGGDPISEKKLDKEEGVWSFKKEILGWDFDGQNFTIQLPPKKCDTIISLIKSIKSLPRVSLNKYQKLCGKLQHASFGIPCGISLFSPLQQAMRFNPKFIKLTKELEIILTDWQYIIGFMKTQPSSVLQLVKSYPDFIGHSDACALGAGGVWSNGLKKIPRPFLWQVKWPEDIVNNLVTSSNPSGTISINDLELAGLVLNWLALEYSNQVPLAFHHVGVFCDNSSAVAWTSRMRTSTSIVAGRLLRILGLRIHARKASSLIPLHISGEDNIQADIISRAFKNGKYFMSNQTLTQYFNTHFPLPQSDSWIECHLPQKAVSRVISSLRGELSPMASLLRLPKIELNIGGTGALIPQHSNVTPSSLMKIPSPAPISSVGLQLESAQATTAEAVKSKFRRAQMLSRPSTRPSSWLENKLPYTRRSKNTSSPSSG